MMQKPKLLLHTCCAPCVTVPLERLKSDYEIVCFFYNPNIHPAEEYWKRLAEIENLAKKLNFQMLVAEYDSEHWFERVKGLENEPEGGARCKICFEMRLDKTAQYAKQEGFDIFTTTLTISPHKNATLINQLGEDLSKRYNVEFLAANFKKRDGFKRSLELSRELNLYRQSYCGCIFSLRNRIQLVSNLT